MKFSFVIPTYNNKVLLGNTLEALNHQEGYCPDDYEVVIVDDGSSDGTEDFIEGINRNYAIEYVYIERSRSSGRAKTRNEGWKKAKGDIIVFIDSDILVKPTHLSEVDRCFRFNERSLVIGNRLMLGDPVATTDITTGKVFETNTFDGNNYDLLDSRYFMFNQFSFNINLHWYPWMHVYSCNMAVSKRDLELTGGFDEHFIEWGMEDVEFGYSLFKNGVAVVLDYRLEVLHQCHGVRNDMSIAESKKEGYLRNVDYFMAKHPGAIGIHPRFARAYFSGDIPLDLLRLDNGPPSRVTELKYDGSADFHAFTEKLVESMKRDDGDVHVIDIQEKSDLDLWIQFNGKSDISNILYFPASKLIKEDVMNSYMNTKRDIKKNLRRNLNR